MKKCQHCGAFVPVEKAFCPNCSEPIEPEEAPNRATTSSSDMMMTIRDDPDNYRELLLSLKKGKPVNLGAKTPAPAPPPAIAPVVSSRTPPIVPERVMPEKSNRRTVVIVLSVASFLILLLVILLAYKLI